jgi:hypothetical protein
MKKIFIMSILTLFLSASGGYVLGEETAKEGAISGTLAYSCPVTVMMMGRDVQVTFDALGVFIADSSDNPFNNASVRILGSGLVLKGAYHEVGSTTYILSNGDKVFATYEGKSIGPKRMKGSIAFIGGTGNFSGITGQGDFERINVQQPAMKGTIQGYTKSKLNWKIVGPKK